MSTVDSRLFQADDWNNTYPRPRMVRKRWASLNGTWQFDLSLPRSMTSPGGGEDDYGVEIRVPYPPESRLSGVDYPFGDEDVRFYRTTFALDDGLLFDHARVLLHFGAVDQVADVFLNGHRLGRHEGGYTHFTFDITDVLEELNDLVVRVEDHLNEGIFPYGKQKHKRGGMWYTPVSGIWQTVWLEAVPAQYVDDIEVVTHGTEVTVKISTADAAAGSALNIADRKSSDAPYPVSRLILSATGTAYEFTGNTVTFTVTDPAFWTPETPVLYDFSIEYGDDRVDSYFALRDLTIELENGMPRLFLNHKPYYFHGVLDQGYFADGLFTPESPAAFEKDILLLKKLGFNMLRKHIKIEPDVFYYCCDKLGMAVFQDMVQNGSYSFIRDTALPGGLGIGLKKSDHHKKFDKNVHNAFRSAMESTVKQLKSHPCIVYWTIFNEGWGQFDSAENCRFLRSLDNTRYIDTASGWFEAPETDVISKHIYFKDLKCMQKILASQKAEGTASKNTAGAAGLSCGKPVVLSEYGGYTYAVEGHVFNPKKSYGYRTFKDLDAYRAALKSLFEEQLRPLIDAGLSADVYTQLSDVEDEINGLITYDRAVEKL